MADNDVAAAKNTIIAAIKLGNWPATEGVTEAMVRQLRDVDVLGLLSDLEKRHPDGRLKSS